MTDRYRALALWCPDWPAVTAAVAAELPADRPVAVVSANRVVACTAGARAEGVRRGLRRREAQGRCPELFVAAVDPDRDGRFFEPVAAAVDALAPGVEVLRPGLLVLAAQGPSGYFGSEEVAAERLVDEVAGAGLECQVGIADALSTAVIAARRGLLVPPGRSAEFLAPLAVAELASEPSMAAPERTELVDLLRRLGLSTIGAFAALTSTDVASRFGADAVLAHRSARGLPERPPAARRAPVELDVELHCDPPVERVDAAAFAARTLAQRLHATLSAAGVACTRLLVRARTDNGEELARTWRCAEPLTPEGTADRVRWQLDGWLTGRSNARPTAGVVLLRLEPVEVVAAGALQLGLWGGVGEGDDRARRALVRVQGLLGGEAVQVGVPSGGRGPAERITLLPWGDERVAATDPAAPWPGRLPAPAPSTVPRQRLAVDLMDAAGATVLVTGRSEVVTDPTALRYQGTVHSVVAWAGPWPVDERWWAPTEAHRAVRLQVLLEGGQALLLDCTRSRWHLEGAYD
ncbi:MAG: DNA polymerase Y family protein [Actinomycetota bacterium]|nr:DNA polymerase Y family protein [Actinomycetota bacterium]